MVNRYPKKYSHSLIIRAVKVKITVSPTSHLLEWLSKRQKFSAGKDGERREPRAVLVLL